MSAIAVTIFTLILIWEVATEGEKVCFDEIGCLSMAPPWISQSRKLPKPFSPKELPVELDFFSRENPDGFFKVDLTRIRMNPSRPTVIITHDYEDESNVLWMRSLKDAYLEQIDANVVIMDWGSGSVGFQYDQASSNIRVLSRVVGKILQKITKKHGLTPKDFHLIGEGLGAHLMGYIGKYFRGIGRITGLDPSREFFEFEDSHVRLHKTDANFVDVIHTSSRLLIPNTGLGLNQPIGHVDFYINIGENQPGCEAMYSGQGNKTNRIIWWNWDDYPNSDQCNHNKARDYFLQAMWRINNCTFWGHKRNIDRTVGNVFGNLQEDLLSAKPTHCTPLSCSPLGLKTVERPARGLFYIKTRKTSPYCIFEHIAPIPKPIKTFRGMINLISGRIANRTAQMKNLFNPY